MAKLLLIYLLAIMCCVDDVRSGPPDEHAVPLGIRAERPDDGFIRMRRLEIDLEPKTEISSDDFLVLLNAVTALKKVEISAYGNTGDLVYAKLTDLDCWCAISSHLRLVVEVNKVIKRELFPCKIVGGAWFEMPLWDDWKFPVGEFKDLDQIIPITVSVYRDLEIDKPFVQVSSSVAIPGKKAGGKVPLATSISSESLWNKSSIKDQILTADIVELNFRKPRFAIRLPLLTTIGAESNAPLCLRLTLLADGIEIANASCFQDFPTDGIPVAWVGAVSCRYPDYSFVEMTALNKINMRTQIRKAKKLTIRLEYDEMVAKRSGRSKVIKIDNSVEIAVNRTKTAKYIERDPPLFKR